MRTLSRLLAPLVALALMAAVVLFAIEVVAAGVGAKPVVVPWHGAYDAAKRNSWTDAGPILLCSALIAVGLLLLVSQTARRRVTDHALSDRSAGVDASLSTRGLRAAVRGAATSLDGVSSAKLTIRRRKGKLEATSHGSDRAAAADLEAPLRTALDERLAGAELAAPPSITVRVTPGKAES